MAVAVAVGVAVAVAQLLFGQRRKVEHLWVNVTRDFDVVCHSVTRRFE